MANSRKEKILVKNAIRGDKIAFEQIVNDNKNLVFNVAYKMLGQYDDANELSQEIFLKVYKSLDKFNFKSKLSTWIYRVATNTCLDYLRKKKLKTYSLDNTIKTKDGEIERDIEDEDVDTERSVLRKEKVNEIRKSILKLKEDYKAIIILREIEGFSYEEISEILDVPTGTVKSRLSRARRELKRIIINDTELFSAKDVISNRKEENNNE